VGRAALLAVIWLSALSCRAPILGVGPVLPRIIEDVGLSHTAAGFLFSIPVLMMGIVGLPGGILADRVGAGRVMGPGLVAIGVASAMRAFEGPAGLFAGTALLGAAVGTLQPALPRVVRAGFADRIGVGTAVYSTGFTCGALLGVAATPALLLPAVGAWGWRGTFVVWGAFAAASALAWPRFREAGARSATGLDPGSFAAVLREPLLWRISGMIVANSAVFYACNAWLTAYYETLGWPTARAAMPLTVLTAVGAAAGFVAPIVSDRLAGRRPGLLASAAATVVGMAGFLWAPAALAWPSAVLFGIGLFANYTLSLALPVDVTPTAHVGAATGVVFALGHGGSLAGALGTGLLRDVTGDFRAGMAALLVTALLMTAFALTIPETYGGRVKIGRREPPGGPGG
jgi:CP family cyanate transporter-like MFS transporter